MKTLLLVLSVEFARQERGKKVTSPPVNLSFNSQLSTLNFELEEGAGPCAAEPCEPRQVRKEATVSG